MDLQPELPLAHLDIHNFQLVFGDAIDVVDLVLHLRNGRLGVVEGCEMALDQQDVGGQIRIVK